MTNTLLDKIKQELQNMDKSDDLNYIRKIIPLTSKQSFSIECNRDENEGFVFRFCIYYQVDKRDIDCCTLSASLTDSDIESLQEFIDMYI